MKKFICLMLALVTVLFLIALTASLIALICFPDLITFLPNLINT